ncbi:MAG: PepSY-associated TM helix domain-containing protein [Vicinamibacterales bacterium]
MKRLRNAFFWVHLVAGTVAGVVILILSLTGAALAFKPQILRLVNTGGFQIEANGRQPLSTSALIDAFRAARPSSEARSVTVARSETEPVSIQSGAATVYLDPYTGAVLGESSANAEQVFRSIENWHRWLAMQGDGRDTGRAIVGIANVVFLLLAASGLYLWWPRAWPIQHLRPILWFRKTATGKARDFNWHHVAGIWSLPMIVVMTLTGVLMSYPSLNSRLQQAVGGSTPGAGAERGPGGGERGPGGRGPGRGDMRGGAAAANTVAVDGGVIDAAVAEAQTRDGEWNSISIEMPRTATAPLTLSIADGSATFASRTQLAVDTQSGEVTRWQPASTPALAQRLRMWVRFGHTGEQWGVMGQALAGVSCLGGALLVWTGFALAIRRAQNAMHRSRQARRVVAVPVRSEA